MTSAPTRSADLGEDVVTVPSTTGPTGAAAVRPGRRRCAAESHYSFLVPPEETSRSPGGSDGDSALRCGPSHTMSRNGTRVGSCKGVVVAVQRLSCGNDDDLEKRNQCRKTGGRQSAITVSMVGDQSAMRPPLLSRKLRREMQTLRELSHENLCRVVGLCVDAPSSSWLLLTALCARGSLRDILDNSDILLDDVFVASLAFDMIKGLLYLHDSQIGCHGNLRATKCLVDSRWILQISGFGLAGPRYGSGRPGMGQNSEGPGGGPPSSTAASYSEKYYFKLLWKSPEHLSEPYPLLRGSQKGDVYSFAIIFHELTHQNGPWGRGRSARSAAGEIIRRLKVQGSGSPAELVRPSIDDAVVPPFIRDCLEMCWDLLPDRRPDFGLVRVMLKPMLKGLRSNIFDNMLLIMEKYATNLEALVEQRTRQLSEEKRKIECLLLRMLPRSVTEQLKVGKPVEPEQYDCASLYFSDIVGFTELSASSTPLQVVQLLNDLYTLFDSVIEEYDVYKVETIGDAYMVASGLPERPMGRVGLNQHAGEIASMALALLRAVRTRFVVRHRAELTLRLRAGIHSGPVVAGVVGLRMPRYCLFGDTVNTASRMEATGEALKIHTSRDCKLILDILGGYHLEKRGIIDVKGKGKMLTYFLEREDEDVRLARVGGTMRGPASFVNNTATVNGCLDSRALSDKDISPDTDTMASIEVDADSGADTFVLLPSGHTRFSHDEGTVSGPRPDVDWHVGLRSVIADCASEQRSLSWASADKVVGGTSRRGHVLGLGDSLCGL